MTGSPMGAFGAKNLTVHRVPSAEEMAVLPSVVESEQDERPTTSTCVSCQTPAACTREWPKDLVPLPVGTVDGLVCDGCHAALTRYAS